MNAPKAEPISRERAAELLIGPYAPVDQDTIKSVFELEGFTPPEDFVVTPFDEFMLSTIVAQSGLRLGDVSSEELAKELRERCKNLGFPSFEFDKVQIDNYFFVLRGILPGSSQQSEQSGQSELVNEPDQSEQPKESNQPDQPEQASQPQEMKKKAPLLRARDFTEIRDRYNALVLLRTARKNPNLIPPFKEQLEQKVAELIMEETTYGGMKEEIHVSLQVRNVIEMIVLDLVEVLDPLEKEELKQELISSIDAYEHESSAEISDIRAFVNEGKFLISSHYSFFPFWAPVIADTWLKKYKSYPAKFRPQKLRYMGECFRHFIQSGSGKANKYLQNNPKYKAHGRFSQQVGSFAVHCALGMEQREFNIVDAIDKIWDQKNVVESDHANQ